MYFLILFISIFSSFFVALVEDKTEARSVKLEHGIVLNPLKHLYLVQRKSYPGLPITFGDLILFMPGTYVTQFFIRKKKLSKFSEISLDKILEHKFKEES